MPKCQKFDAFFYHPENILYTHIILIILYLYNKIIGLHDHGITVNMLKCPGEMSKTAKSYIGIEYVIRQSVFKSECLTNK